MVGACRLLLALVERFDGGAELLQLLTVGVRLVQPPGEPVQPTADLFGQTAQLGPPGPLARAGLDRREAIGQVVRRTRRRKLGELRLQACDLLVVVIGARRRLQARFQPLHGGLHLVEPRACRRPRETLIQRVEANAQLVRETAQLGAPGTLERRGLERPRACRPAHPRQRLRHRARPAAPAGRTPGRATPSRQLRPPASRRAPRDRPPRTARPTCPRAAPAATRSPRATDASGSRPSSAVSRSITPSTGAPDAASSCRRVCSAAISSRRGAARLAASMAARRSPRPSTAAATDDASSSTRGCRAAISSRHGVAAAGRLERRQALDQMVDGATGAGQLLQALLQGSDIVTPWRRGFDGCESIGQAFVRSHRQRAPRAGPAARSSRRATGSPQPLPRWPRAAPPDLSRRSPQRRARRAAPAAPDSSSRHGVADPAASRASRRSSERVRGGARTRDLLEPRLERCDLGVLVRTDQRRRLDDVDSLLHLGQRLEHCVQPAPSTRRGHFEPLVERRPGGSRARRRRLRGRRARPARRCASPAPRAGCGCRRASTDRSRARSRAPRPGQACSQARQSRSRSSERASRSASISSSTDSLPTTGEAGLEAVQAGWRAPRPTLRECLPRRLTPRLPRRLQAAR